MATTFRVGDIVQHDNAPDRRFIVQEVGDQIVCRDYLDRHDTHPYRLQRIRLTIIKPVCNVRLQFT